MEEGRGRRQAAAATACPGAARARLGQGRRDGGGRRLARLFLAQRSKPGSATHVDCCSSHLEQLPPPVEHARQHQNEVSGLDRLPPDTGAAGWARMVAGRMGEQS